MNMQRLFGAVASVVVSLLLTAGANAGGLEANGYDWDLLFDPATYAGKATATYVHIDKDVTNARVRPGTVSTTPARVHYNTGFKADIKSRQRGGTGCAGARVGRDFDRSASGFCGALPSAYPR